MSISSSCDYKYTSGAPSIRTQAGAVPCSRLWVACCCINLTLLNSEFIRIKPATLTAHRLLSTEVKIATLLDAISVHFCGVRLDKKKKKRKTVKMGKEPRTHTPFPSTDSFIYISHFLSLKPSTILNVESQFSRPIFTFVFYCLLVSVSFFSIYFTLNITLPITSSSF